MEWKDLFSPFVDLVFWTFGICGFVKCDSEMLWVELKME